MHFRPLVALYLGAVVAANLIVTQLGPAFSPATAFVFIGATLTVRDRLQYQGLRTRHMYALILAGGLISAAINWQAAPIALASGIAFGVSESVDWFVYQLARKLSWMQRVNASNAVGAAFDSILFPTIAFGAFLPVVVLAQFAAKTLGGALWAAILRPRIGRFGVLVGLALLLWATPSNAQIIAVGVGGISTPASIQPAIDAFVAGPELARLRPNAVISFARGDEKPTVLTKVSGRLTPAGPGTLLVLEAGAIFLPFRDYKHEWIVGAYASTPLPDDRLRLAIGANIEPRTEALTVFAKVDVTLWFRR